MGAFFTGGDQTQLAPAEIKHNFFYINDTLDSSIQWSVILSNRLFEGDPTKVRACRETMFVGQSVVIHETM